MSLQQNAAYQTYCALPIDFSSVELYPDKDFSSYFCTPNGARLLGCIGTDGVHFCDIPTVCGDTVFSISPMNGEPFILPIAANFVDFLCEVYTCRSAGVVEQLAWMEEKCAADHLAYTLLLDTSTDPAKLQQACRFFGLSESLLPDTAARSAKQDALNTICRVFDLSPIDNVYQHIHQVRQNFDFSVLSFSDEYYDVLGLEKPN